MPMTFNLRTNDVLMFIPVFHHFIVYILLVDKLLYNEFSYVNPLIIEYFKIQFTYYFILCYQPIAKDCKLSTLLLLIIMFILFVLINE